MRGGLFSFIPNPRALSALLSLLSIAGFTVALWSLSSYFLNGGTDSPLAPARPSSEKFSLPSAVSPAEEQAKARHLQSIYCSNFFPLPSSGSTMKYVPVKIDGLHPGNSRTALRTASGDPIGMFVVGDNKDVVSNSIIEHGVWEDWISSGILTALAEGASVKVNDPLFLDIGSNLGFHSVAALAHGYRVLSIDALTLNAHHFMSTLCQTPKLMEKSIFIRNGLGSKPSTCAITSDDGNLGDGSVTCEASDIAKYKQDPRPAGMKPLRQFLDVAPLDRFVNEDVWTVKMDVEGFELDVLKGASQLFSKHKVYYLLTEVMGDHPKTKEMVWTVKKLGYSCSEQGWYGKRVAIPDSPEKVQLRGDVYNYWCIHPEHLKTVGLVGQVERALANV
ncbi:S-adenosyl-L-methionine-dependent methyltransferase [Zopfochytrium polystomum]|nr:S-adenosyl-L-methionine-dependent methyltransferase [Zopfochytrium polystomum]